MRSDKFDENDWQFYLIAFLILIFCLVIYVAIKFWWIKAPDLETDSGRCEAFCAGIGKMALGQGRELPLTCFCDYPPTPIDKRMLRRP
jgi:hypothetical protein